MKQVRSKYANNPDFDPDKIKNASTACEGLSKWVLAIEKYDKSVYNFHSMGLLAMRSRVHLNVFPFQSCQGRGT